MSRYNGVDSDLTYAAATQSLINYMPSSYGGSFLDPEVQSESSDDLPLPSAQENLDEDENCLHPFRTCRDEAGAWDSHRFHIKDWSRPGDCLERSHLYNELALDESEQDGILSNRIIGLCLSRLDRSPEYSHYALTKCVLSKKKLNDIDSLKSYYYIQYLDLSTNKLTSLSSLGQLPFLKYLDASHNLLKTVLDFKPPFFLTSVNLSHNKIKIIPDLSDFWSITDLNLSHNGITVISGLTELKFLSILNLSSNRISVIQNLNNLRIQYLYLQNNIIQYQDDDELSALWTLANIRTINISHNLVTSLKIFENVENLECLEAASNRVSKLLDIFYLRNLKYLSRLNLQFNPVTGIKRYVEVAVTNIKNISFLDGEKINSDFWLRKISEKFKDVNQEASHQRLKLLLLEQVNEPTIWEWIVPFDTPPLGIIVLVGPYASKRGGIAKKFCKINNGVVFGVPYTTRPKPKEEIGGENYHYIDLEQFLTMTKNGKFLTFHESLGHFYGIAHSEFEKAKNKTLVFYTDISMALKLRTKYFNAKLVLTLTSTEKAHIENIKHLFTFRLLDADTILVENTLAETDLPQDISDQRTDSIQKKVTILLNEIVHKVCHVAHKKQLSEVKKNKQDEQDILQLWINNELENNKCGFVDNERTELLHPLNYDNSEVNNNLKDTNSLPNEEDVPDQGNSENKSVSFKKLIESSDQELGREPTSANALHCLGSWNSLIGFNSLKHGTYGETIDDDTIKRVFSSVLKFRDQLLQLHWSTPGLFRELLFTDYEQESLDKLKHLHRDMKKTAETSRKQMFDFSNDHNFKTVTESKMQECFKDLHREVSISDKQAAEYLSEEQVHICSHKPCNNAPELRCVKF